MTVKELIVKLEEYDPETPVVINSGSVGHYDVINVIGIALKLDFYRDDTSIGWNPPHLEDFDSEVFNAVTIDGGRDDEAKKRRKAKS